MGDPSWTFSYDGDNSTFSLNNATITLTVRATSLSWTWGFDDGGRPLASSELQTRDDFLRWGSITHYAPIEPREVAPEEVLRAVVAYLGAAPVWLTSQAPQAFALLRAAVSGDAET